MAYTRQRKTKHTRIDIDSPKNIFFTDVDRFFRLTRPKRTDSVTRRWRCRCTWDSRGRWGAWRSGWSSSGTRWSAGSPGSTYARRPCSCAACPYWRWPRSAVTGRGTSCLPGCTACSAAGTITRSRCTRTRGSGPETLPARGALSSARRPYQSPWGCQYPVSRM